MTPDFPTSLLTNTYILHDYQEIAYIVCTDALPATIGKSVVHEDLNSEKSVLARLRLAERQFREASILVVLDPAARELITFYKKADIVKDQQTILARFTSICKANACKIERKHACRVVDLLKPEKARIWNHFSEAIFASLVLRTPSGRRILGIDGHVYLVPDMESTSHHADDIVRTCCDTKYRLHKAELQILSSGHLLLILKEALWPSMYALGDILDAESLLWNLPDNAMLYLAPTGQPARYTGGWIGKQGTAESKGLTYRTYSREELYQRLCWFEKAQDWLDSWAGPIPAISRDDTWCSVEIPVVEDSDDLDDPDLISLETVLWKMVVWPVHLIYVVIDARTPGLKTEREDPFADPLSAAQAWFSTGLNELRAKQSKDTFQANVEDAFNDRNLFDDDTQFGSPQQFMNVPPQMLQNSRTIYPTPPEAMNIQHTPGFSMDGAAQTPVSAHQTHPSIYQSSPMAAMTEVEVIHPNEAAISSFLQHSDDDLFEDEEGDDSKLVQPSFGDEPNWDFFDRDPTVLDFKPALTFQESSSATGPAQSVDDRANARLDAPRSPSVVQHDWEQAPAKGNSMAVGISDAKVLPDGTAQDTPKPLVMTENASSFIPAAQDLNAPETRELAESSALPGAKRRRSSIYDVNLQIEDGHDHKYGPAGKYHFELKKPSITVNGVPPAEDEKRRSSSSSVSSWSTMSHVTSINGRIVEGPGKSWTRYEPSTVNEMTEISTNAAHKDPVYLAQIDQLLDVISRASGIDPFKSLLPIKPDYGKTFLARETMQRWYTISQILTEMLTQSSLFKLYDGLQIPVTKVSPAFDVFVENIETGSSTASASLHDLLTISATTSNLSVLARSTSLEVDRLRLRQAEVEISAELPIIKYWETMNLQPWSGMKNVQAVCIHPDGSNYRQGCEAFMKRIKETYTSCNLGDHNEVHLKGLAKDGILAWSSGAEAPTLASLCRSIGELIGSRPNSGCTVVYAILPNNGVEHAVEVCDAFLELFEALGSVERLPENDVVLQLVPSSFIISADSLVVRPQKEFVDLALEVYNRVPSLQQGDSSMTAGAIVLEKPIGRPPHFELDSKITRPSAGYGNCLHVAYCISADGRWLFATWSDGLGNSALTLPYCLTETNDGPQWSRIDVFRNMTEVSIRLMDRQKGNSWLTIARVGLFEFHEVQDWHSLWQGADEELKSVSRIVIVSVELQSRISLRGPLTTPKQATAVPQPQMNTFSTPATTPQAAITSPDQAVPVTPTTSMAVNASTPPDLTADPGTETDTYLSSLANEAWALTFTFGLDQTNKIIDTNHTLASGLLIRRNSQQDKNGGLSVLNVSLISIPRNSTKVTTNIDREQILQDIITQYRALHVLAVARRCVDDTEGCVPWHIATAFKGARILEKLM